ncbi:metalloregulator ArsR/SmtB family transcription factor [Nocardia bovistercoris]|uniref:Winged helix-turn-helix transcriptional regulator n=1 Tax=Nocardia bovistercoris TaxID=2785916 RepID=A0A931N1Z8_9NOCA|nr:winged helix-turn-helix transcriptional regulator [Nocardia bovistercoris]
MDDVAGAISDPVRRQIMELLHGRRLTAGEIASRFDISRPAISRHLRVLRECGLVRDEVRGRERYYVLDAEPLAELLAWIGRVRGREPWSARLDAFETEVYRTRRERRAVTPNSTTPDTTQEHTA